MKDHKMTHPTEVVDAETDKGHVVVLIQHIDVCDSYYEVFVNDESIYQSDEAEAVMRILVELC